MRNLLLLLIPLYLGYHLFVLDKQPLPTFDEAVLAKCTQDVSKTGLEYFQSSQFDTKSNNAVFFSPLFVCLNIPIVNYLGYSLFSLRILAITFSVFILLLMFSYFGEFEKGSYKNASFLFLVVFILDPIFNLHLHANGGIILAIFFLLFSLKTEFRKKEHDFSSTIFSAFLTTLALLSYLPILFVLPFLILHKILSTFSGTSEEKSYHFSHLVIWTIFVAALFGSWLFFAQLTISNVIQKSFLAPIWNSNPNMFFIYIIPAASTFAILVYSAFQRKYTIENKLILFLLIGMGILFIVCNGIFQKNFLFLIPFFYLVFFGLLPLNITDSFARTGRYLPIFTALAINLLLFLIQLSNTLSNYRTANDDHLKNFISKYVPDGQEVISDASSSISIISTGYQLLTIKSSLDLNEKLKITQSKFAIISEDFEEQNGYTGSTLEYNGFRKIAKIEYKKSDFSLFMSSIGLVPDNEDHLYSAQIYSR